MCSHYCSAIGQTEFTRGSHREKLCEFLRVFNICPKDMNEHCPARFEFSKMTRKTHPSPGRMRISCFDFLYSHKVRSSGMRSNAARVMVKLMETFE